MIVDRLALPQLAETDVGSLHVPRAILDRRHAVSNRHAAIVMRMDAEAALNMPESLCTIVEISDAEGSTVGIAQHQHVGAALNSGLQGLDRIVRPFTCSRRRSARRREYTSLPLALKKAQRLANHVQILVERGADDVSHVKIPALAENHDHRCIGQQQRLNIAVLLGRNVTATGTAKGRQLGVFQSNILRPGKKLEVAGFEPGLPAST